MGLDTYAAIVNRVQLRCPLAGPMLAREWVRYAFRKVAESRHWSWLHKQGQFLFTAEYTTGTVAVTHNSSTVTGTSTAWTQASHNNKQWRRSGTTPIYTITAVDEANQLLTLDRPYGGDTESGVTYSLYTAYSTVPSDFHSFISVIDPQLNWRLHTHASQADLDSIDAQRSNAGNPWTVADHSYDTSASPPLPRYEVWPHVKSQYVIPFLYVRRHDDLDDSGATLPRYIRGDVLLEFALAEAALWPGPSMQERNPYHSMEIYREHMRKATEMLIVLERQDDEVTLQDVSYQRYFNSQFAPFPMDAAFIQSHGM